MAKWVLDEDVGELRFVQIATSIAEIDQCESECLYGLTDKGQLYQWSGDGQWWIPVPMRAAKQAK